MEHLAALAQAQEELLAALACKREATKETVPDPIAICRARWNVSRASRSYRAIVASILPEMMDGAGPDDLAAIRGLQSAGIEQTQRSTRHIQIWTPDRVMTSWREFCAASATLQRDMDQRIQTENALIGRLLRERAKFPVQARWAS